MGDGVREEGRRGREGGARAELRGHRGRPTAASSLLQPQPTFIITPWFGPFGTSYK